MLYIKTTDGQEYEWTWNSGIVCYTQSSHDYLDVGEAFRTYEHIRDLRSKDIKSIKATDGELCNIISKCYNIPTYKHSDIHNECCWFGDHAKFIAVAIGAANC
jgi:hypothetical protein